MHKNQTITTTNQETITLMIGADQNYFLPTMILLTSFFHNHMNQPVTVYLLHKDFTQQQLAEFECFISCWEHKEVIPIAMTPKIIGGLKSFGRFSVATYFRILGMYLLPPHVKRVLYLDVDMIVNQNLSELFQMELTHPLMANYDINNYLQGNIEYHKRYLGIPEKYGYFNAGMLLMDLEAMRESNAADRLLEDIAQHAQQYELVDQDALNKLFYQQVHWLDWRLYDCPCIHFYAKTPNGDQKDDWITYPEIMSASTLPEMYNVTDQILKQAKIIHFCTQYKPWRDLEFFAQNKDMAAAINIYRTYMEIYFQKMQERS